jgi:hypothetical protein
MKSVSFYIRQKLIQSLLSRLFSPHSSVQHSSVGGQYLIRFLHESSGVRPLLVVYLYSCIVEVSENKKFLA